MRFAESIVTSEVRITLQIVLRITRLRRWRCCEARRAITVVVVAQSKIVLDDLAPALESKVQRLLVIISRQAQQQFPHRAFNRRQCYICGHQIEVGYLPILHSVAPAGKYRFEIGPVFCFIQGNNSIGVRQILIL
jgi:hypothetical protein